MPLQITSTEVKPNRVTINLLNEDENMHYDIEISLSGIHGVRIESMNRTKMFNKGFYLDDRCLIACLSLHNRNH